MNSIKVGMADFKVAKDNGSLVTIGLGSCVGIALYDPTTKIGGLAHIMLPDSTRYRSTGSKINLAKYADSSIEKMLEKMKKLGANTTHILAKIAGGAHMFKSANGFLKIGEENVKAVKKILKDKKINIKAEDTGADYGRTVELDVANGNYSIRSAVHGTKVV